MADQKPLISVVTASFNSAKTIGRTLESLRQQSDKRFEAIVIDGGSDDGTVKIVERFSDIVSHFVSAPDHGIYDAMNKGIALATGQIIAFLNSDDAYFSDTLANVIAASRRSKAEIFYGSIVKVRELDGQIFNRTEHPKLENMPKTMGVFHPATFIKADLFKQFGSYDLRFKLASDYHWLLRAFLQDVQFEEINRPLAKFTVGGISNYSCGSYREAAIIQKELDTGHHREMEKLYARCKRKARFRPVRNALTGLPLIKQVYLNRVKKRWA
jgi:glycosyltransferase involved in cell wall biosynthesis